MDVQVTISDVPDWFEESAGRAFVFPLQFVPNADVGVTDIHVIDILCGPEIFPVDSPNDLAARMVIAIYTGATDPAVAARVFDQMWLRHGEY
ncbi:hypothetical protein [Octadecabacter ascidiaceicola]|uniref:hypothetical protein n=1 Tax=Octadecabacter ascidiaceicola TaxID=1655543 RepID=UPI0011811D3B|nr:hypothetical protein [Octadecabacter ascidiaceicola]